MFCENFETRLIFVFFSLFVQPLDVCAKNAMVNVSFAIPMCGRAPWYGFVMNAITVHIRADVSFAVDLAYPMPTTAKSARFKRKM